MLGKRPPNFNDLTGKRFGKLVALNYTIKLSPSGRKRTYWECICDCGNKSEVESSNLTYGHTKSCGCSHKESSTLYKTKHGMTTTRFYGIWNGMKNRILNPHLKCYPRYGGKGLKLQESWKVFDNFKNDMYENYLKHVELYGEDETTLDRLDNDKGYSKDNCKWSTNKEQSLNRSTNKKYMVNGEMLTATGIAEKYNMTYSTVMHRLCRGWSIERILLQKPRKGRVLDGTK